MQYIDQDVFGRPRAETLPMSPSAVRSPRRGVAGADFAAPNGLSADVLVPVQLDVTDASTSGMHLVRLGFRITAPSNVRIEWVRFTVTVAAQPGTVRGEQAPAIVCVYPRRVDRPMAPHGRIAVDGMGDITREYTPADPENKTTVTYSPHALGLRTTAGEAVWNWLPADQAPPIGSDALFMSVSGGRSGPALYRRSLYAAVRDVDTPDYVIVEQVSEAAAIIPAK